MEHLHRHPPSSFRHDVTSRSCPSGRSQPACRHLRSTTAMIQCRRPRHRCMAHQYAGSRKRPRVPYLPASTSEVYGDPTIHADGVPTGATSIHWASSATMRASVARKRCSSTIIAARPENTRSAIFYTYGPRMHPAEGGSSRTSSFKRSPVRPFGSRRTESDTIVLIPSPI